MITKTSILAMGALIYLCRSGSPMSSPKQIADVLGESPSYMAKVLGRLVKAGILRAQKGTKGGVQLNHPPAQISLLSIVEACQGIIAGNYCKDACNPATTCAYHQAAIELQQAIMAVLSGWNLQHLSENRPPLKVRPDGSTCRLLGIKQSPAVVPRRRR